MNAVEAFSIFLIEFIKVVFRILAPIFIIISILIIIKILLRYRKYGKVEFDVFRKRKDTKFSDIIINMIEKIDNQAIYWEPDNLYADFVLATASGFYLLKIVKYQGFISGERQKNQVQNRVKTSTVIDRENPFYYLDQDKNKIMNLDCSLKVKTILVTNNHVNISINHVPKEEVLNLQNFYYEMLNHLKKSKIYSKEYIENIAELIKRI